MAVKGANDRRGTCVNRSNEASGGLDPVGLRERRTCHCCLLRFELHTVGVLIH